MGLFQFLASFAIRKQLMKHLRANCPEGVKNEMETLLANKKASSLILQLMMSAMQSRSKLQADAVTSLPLPADIGQLLSNTPKLVTYLLLATRMSGKK